MAKQIKQGKGDNDLFTKVRIHHVNPTSLLRRLELPTGQLQAGSLSNAFPKFTSSIFFLAEVRSQPLQTIPWLTTTLVAHRATPSRLGGFTSKSNKCHNELLDAIQSAQDLGLAHLGLAHLGLAHLCSHTTNLSTQLKDMQSITQVSQ